VDALDLGAKSPVALAGDVDDVLEELAPRDTLKELLVGDEVVVDAVHLPFAAGTRRRRHGELEVGPTFEQCLDERALAGAGWSRDDEELRPVAQRRSSPTSSVR
jgi:hypothetical protein